MTTDETVREIMQLFSAVDYEGRTRPVVLTVYPERCTARACSHAVDVPGGATAALAALRDQLRGKASNALREHEAKAEVLRKALGIPSPTMAGDDLRAAVREYFVAERAFDDAKCRGVYNLIFDADQKMRRAREAMLTALGSHGPKSPPADAMGGAL